MVRHDGSEDNTLGPDDCKAHSLCSAKSRSSGRRSSFLRITSACGQSLGCAHPQLGCCAFYLFIRADPNLIGLPICRDYACMISSFVRARPWARPQTQTLSC